MSDVETRLAILREREVRAWMEYLGDVRSVAPNGYEATEQRSWRRLLEERAGIRAFRRAVEFEIQHSELLEAPKRRSR